jgi:hypothetical protein
MHARAPPIAWSGLPSKGRCTSDSTWSIGTACPYPNDCHTCGDVLPLCCTGPGNRWRVQVLCQSAQSPLLQRCGGRYRERRLEVPQHQRVRIRPEAVALWLPVTQRDALRARGEKQVQHDGSGWRPVHQVCARCRLPGSTWSRLVDRPIEILSSVQCRTIHGEAKQLGVYERVGPPT